MVAEVNEKGSAKVLKRWAENAGVTDGILDELGQLLDQSDAEVLEVETRGQPRVEAVRITFQGDATDDDWCGTTSARIIGFKRKNPGVSIALEWFPWGVIELRRLIGMVSVGDVQKSGF